MPVANILKNMKKTFLVLFLIINVISYCKSQKVDTVYLDINGFPTTYKKHKLFRTIVKTGNVYKVEEYSKKGNIIKRGYYKNANLTERTGPFYHYYKNFPRIEIFEPSKHSDSIPEYRDLIKIIPAKSDSFILYLDFYTKNRIKLIGYLNYNRKGYGTWLSFNQNGNLRFKYGLKNSILDGDYLRYLSFPDTLRNGQYNNGKRNGEWKFYYRNGDFKKKVIFHDGKRIK